MKKNTASRIIFELSKEKDGLTNSEIEGIIGDKDLTYNHLKYYLDEFVKTKVLKKSGTKYILLRKSFIINGSAIVDYKDKMMFLDCPYYGNKCKQCYNNISNGEGSCLLVNDLPKFLQKSVISQFKKI